LHATWGYSSAFDVRTRTIGKAAPESMEPHLTYKDLLKKAIDGGFDGATEAEKAVAVEETIRMSSSRAALVVLQPLPLVDGALLMPLHRKMVQCIGRVRGHPEKEATDAIFRALLGRIVTPHLTIAGIKCIPFVPVLPDIIAMSVAYALTYTLGTVSDDCFRAAAMPEPCEVRKRFDAIYRKSLAVTYREKRDEVKARFRRRRSEQARGAQRGEPSLSGSTTTGNHPHT
jgi:uncharacterized protein (DUF697 family)